jgi:phosphatidylglycerol lysyltransferase
VRTWAAAAWVPSSPGPVPPVHSPVRSPFLPYRVTAHEAPTEGPAFPIAGPPPTAGWRRLLRWVPPVVGVALFAAAALVLHRELRAVSYAEVRGTLSALPPAVLALSLLLCAANYAVLACFDLLAFRYVGRRLASWKVALASFVGYAVSNNVGFALVSGVSVRYRFYSRWGLGPGEISRVVVFYFGTFWLGLLLLGGWTLAVSPPAALEELAGAGATAGAGWALLAGALVYLAASAAGRGPLRVGRLELPIPRPRIAAAQYLLSTVDWALAAGIFYVLLPPSGLGFGEFLAIFLAAQLLALLSHVPGGVGVFDGAMLVMLGGTVAPEVLVSTLVVYRLVYYILPLAAALAILLGDELRLRREAVERWAGTFGTLAPQVAPRILAVFTFLAGALLLASGTTPTQAQRLEWLARHLPLALVEGAWVAATLAGAGLLVASHAVARRLHDAFPAAVALLLAGTSAALLRGAAYGEPLLLGLLLCGFLASRPAFTRRAGFWEARFSPGWSASVLAVLGTMAWLTLFAFPHAELGDWWRFDPEQEAPRALRATLLAGGALLVFGALRLRNPAPPERRAPGERELARAGELLARQPSTLPYLVYLRDKTLLFSRDGRAFLMYGVQGRSWVVLGDPVGDADAVPMVVRRFVERCDDYGAVPVFYQAGEAHLELYAHFGLTCAALGEEALVELPGFDLEGEGRRPFRRVVERFAESGGRFRVAPPTEVPSLLPALEEVSERWLGERGRERGFSLGFFSPEYLIRFPVALAEHGGRVTAFATLWPGPGRVELSADLVRSDPAAPRGTVEALLLHLMLWGRDEGYGRFDLGMAPLPEPPREGAPPVWARLGNFVFRRGARAAHFRRLRVYKERFDPVWERRWLVYPGGLRPARVHEDVSLLITKGYRDTATLAVP